MRLRGIGTTEAQCARPAPKRFEPHHARLLRTLLGTVDHYTGQIRHLDTDIAALITHLAGPGEQ